MFNKKNKQKFRFVFKFKFDFGHHSGFFNEKFKF